MDKLANLGLKIIATISLYLLLCTLGTCPPARCGPAGKLAALCGFGRYHFPGIFAALKRMIKEHPHFPS